MRQLDASRRRALFYLLSIFGSGNKLTASSHKPGFQLVPSSNIVIEFGGPGDPRIIHFAVEESQRYIGQMLGHHCHFREIERNWPDKSYRIRLTSAGFKAGAFRTETTLAAASTLDEFEIESAAGSLTLTGSNARSLLYAVYHVLGEQGCQWLLPSRAGEIISAKSRLIFLAGKTRTRAAFSMRGLAPVEDLQRYTARDVAIQLDWMAKNRLNCFVAIMNYGGERLKRVILEESEKRGIKVVGYLWSFELFLPLSLFKEHPDYFPFIKGARRAAYNVKRCPCAPGAIQTFVENGQKWFRNHRDILDWVVSPNDGYDWCECAKCHMMKPKDQWAAFFVPLWEAVRRDNPEIRFQNFLYVWRYGVPKNVQAYRDAKMFEFFDTFPRNKWYSLRDPAAPPKPNPYGLGEAAFDPHARGISINNYLTDRLRDWLAVADGRVWIFEDLMVHGAFSFPIPNLPYLADDVRAARREGVGGYLFEAFLEQWNSFACEIWALARLCWDTTLDPVRLHQEFYQKLLGEQAGALNEFYRRFFSDTISIVRKRGGFYWFHCAPEAADRYIKTVSAIRQNALSGAGQLWHERQMRIATVMEQILRQGKEPAGMAILASRKPKDVLAICRSALAAETAMDGVFFVYEQLRLLFMREFGADALGSRPVFPPDFGDVELRSLFAHAKLWDTLAEWEAAGEFPSDSNHPDRQIVATLHHAIGQAESFFSRGSAPSRSG